MLVSRLQREKLIWLADIKHHIQEQLYVPESRFSFFLFPTLSSFSPLYIYIYKVLKSLAYLLTQHSFFFFAVFRFLSRLFFRSFRFLRLFSMNVSLSLSLSLSLSYSFNHIISFSFSRTVSLSYFSLSLRHLILNSPCVQSFLSLSLSLSDSFSLVFFSLLLPHHPSLSSSSILSLFTFLQFLLFQSIYLSIYLSLFFFVCYFFPSVSLSFLWNHSEAIFCKQSKTGTEAGRGGGVAMKKEEKKRTIPRDRQKQNGGESVFSQGFSLSKHFLYERRCLCGIWPRVERDFIWVTNISVCLSVTMYVFYVCL